MAHTLIDAMARTAITKEGLHMCRDEREWRRKLRKLLAENADRFGLPREAIDILAANAASRTVPAGTPPVAPDEAADLVTFLTDGVARIAGRGPHDEPMTLTYVKEGQFTGTGWLFGTWRGPGMLTAVAHGEARVAMWERGAMARMLDPDAASQLMACAGVYCAALLGQTFAMLAMSLRERLHLKLALLARDFGRPWQGIPAGRLILLHLRRGDLAELVIAAPPNVGKAVIELREAGMIVKVGHRILVTEQGLSTAPMRRQNS
jgi:CRP-like cAMP-binding protein